ncbi:Signal transduction histidine-protein kinase BarA [Pseudoalteromonas sp. P1-16-1b]|uniref:ATP-binding protein n=1 Tax=Pseudoalteromonas sp. P1-16-1b TaxID=1723757 RepID=UPI0006D6544A|nr:ATP-binding protein [Pseudoalteromonas sp. P1-16-1b]KPZ66607.1 Signal transduction histidine-protein kinase BarA [Pseudoalteromonas sp. P1-16-1b]
MPINLKKRIIRQVSNYTLLFPISLSAIITLIVVAIIINEASLSRSVLGSVELEIIDKNQSINSQTQEVIENYRRDIRFLHATPPIKGLARASNHKGVDPLENTTYAQWKTRLEIIFAAFLKNNPDYEQLRIISTNKKGQELVRVDRVQGAVEVIDLNRLQNKGAQEYFTASSNLSDGEMYLSEISLNREYGKIEFPYRPMLRLSMPIFDENQNRFGFIIINVNANNLLTLLKNSINTPFQLALTDSNGYFLSHPNKDFTFGKDLNSDISINNNYTFNPVADSSLSLIKPKSNAQTSYYTARKKITLALGEKQNFLSSHVLAPVEHIKNIEMERRTKLYAFLLILVVVLTIILAFFNRSLRKSQELANARAQSEAIITGSSDAVIGITNNGIVSSWNNAAALMFKLGELEAIGKSINDLKIIDQLNFNEIIEKFTDGTRQFKQNASISNGSTKRYFSLSLSAIIDQFGMFIGIAIIARDVTKERTIENEIIKVNHELENKVAIRTKELKQASEVKSAFISNISHEMRTPLNGIVGTLNLIKKEPLSETQKNYLEMTEVSVSALSVLINDILDLSKIEAGKLELNFKEFNLIKLIESVCGSMAVKAQEKGLEFVLDVVNLKCKTIKTDPHRFSQILTNLVNNAIKFTETGFIKVTAYCEQTSNDNVTVHVNVTDSGVGIAQENQSKLFTAFSQEDKSVASKFGGTGLGLSICRQLCNLLGGEISFESEKSLGSSFHIKLTLSNADTTHYSFTPRLKNKSFAIVTKNNELADSINNLIAAFSGNSFSSEQLQQSLLSDDIENVSLPDFILIEQDDTLLKRLDEMWSSIANHHAIKVILLANRGYPQIKTRHMQASLLSKPILISEFLKTVADERSIENKISENSINKRRESDSVKTDNSDFKGAHVLIVDDNDINIEVAAGILSCLSLEIDTASNGQQAVEKLVNSVANNHQYHCVFMDCQMPILNGYDAAKKIRAGEATPQNINIPIVAMTANAMMGERQKCLDAGMSDYITKPISAEVLVATATKWLSSTFMKEALLENNQLNEFNKPTPDTLDSQSLPDWDKDNALSRLLNNENLLIKVCELYLQSTPVKLEELEDAINNNNLSQISKLSHGLKGSSGDVGAANLHKLFDELEVMASENAMGSMKNKLELIQTSYKKLESTINSYLEIQPSS